MFFNDRTDIKIINNKNYTPGKALNIGVKNASRDYVMILSAHSQILKLDFKSIKKKLDTYIAIFGKQIPIYMGKRITPRYIWTHFNDEETINMYSNLENRYFFHNAFFFSKNLLSKTSLMKCMVVKKIGTGLKI